MAVSFDQFLSEINPECPGVPNPVAINAVRNACFDFCRESLWWNEVQDPYSYSQGVSQYQIDAPNGAQIAGVLNLNLDEKRVIYPTPTEQVSEALPGWASTQGNIIGFAQPALNTVQLFPVPQENGYFIPMVAYAPSRSATSIDDRIYNLHLETIKYGALWKLKMMAGQPWADPAGAAYYEGHFWMGVNAATVERNRGNTRATMRVAPRPFV